jgi:TonB dependent receptor-like, beta-barrel/TonB-dependent Receptor Plug Domain
MAARVLLIVLIVLLSAPAVSFGGQAQARNYAGRAVADVLRELQATHLKIIFSSERVPPALRVVKEPRGTDPRDIALQVLEPHGLTLQQGPGGTFIVVARPPRREETRKPPPPKREPAQPAGPPGDVDSVRIAEHVEVTDRTTDSGVSPRAYAVEPVEVREMAGGMENVLQSLQVQPGVAGTNDEDGKLAVRGAGPEHNLIVLDGVQIHNAQRLGEWTTSFVNPATAASVTLDPSGLDARFGGRLSSVVNLETRDGTTARALAMSGSLGLTSGDVLFEGRMPGTSSGSWWATARGTYYRFVFDRFDDGAIPSFGDLQVKATLYPTRRTRLTLFGLAGREMLQTLDQERDGAVVVRESDRGDNRIAAGTLRWMPSSRFSSATTISAYSTTSRYVDRMIALIAGNDAFDRRLVLQDYAVRQQVLFAPAKDQLIDAGVDLHRVRSSWQMTGFKQPEWWRGIGPSTWGELVDYSSGPIDSYLQRTQAGAWFQIRLPASSLFVLEPGIRVDWNSFTGEAAWQPRLRLSRAIGRGSAWAGFSMQAQTPSHESLQGFEYFDFSGDNSEGLRNARTQQIVVGTEQPIGAGFGLRVEGYYRSLDRLLVQCPETDAERRNRLRPYEIPDDMPLDSALLEHRPTVFPISIGAGQAAGVEILLKRERRRLSGWMGYTLSKATRDLYGRTVPSDFDRRHALNAVIEAAFTRAWRASATWRLASGFPTTPVREEVVFDSPVLLDGTRREILRPVRNRDGQLVSFLDVFQRRLSTINSERLTGYSRLDARLSYSTRRHWEFYGEILNLLNSRNHLQRVTEHRDGQARPVGEANVYNTFERMGSFGLRVTF